MFKFLFLFTFALASLVGGTQCVGYTFSGGRFGDNLVAYMHAKWVAYRYQIPLLYTPFPHAIHLVLHNDKINTIRTFPRTAKRITLAKESFINLRNREDICYVVPYFPEAPLDMMGYSSGVDLEIDWEDEGFRAELRRLISPVTPTRKLSLPPNRISVALHARTGGGFDSPQAPQHIPHKLPPESYYVEQVRHLYALCDEQPLYVHLFTDDLEPDQFLKRLKGKLSDLNIVWGGRTSDNRHNLHMIEDFFAMTQFQCLIRPDSNYSIAASKIADYSIIISPAHVSFVAGKPVIDRVEVVRRGKR
jgi:hypothetical protein